MSNYSYDPERDAFEVALEMPPLPVPPELPRPDLHRGLPARRPTLREVMDEFRQTEPNTMSERQILNWCSRLDLTVNNKIILTHEHRKMDEQFRGYADIPVEDAMELRLLVPEPYDHIYLFWLMSQVQLANGEVDRYTNSAALYNAAYRDYRNYINRTRMPLEGGARR